MSVVSESFAGKGRIERHRMVYEALGPLMQRQIHALALRTFARFMGTLRMWNGHHDGLHIYITAQLLGMLVPILVAGPKTLDFLGFIIALNWCYLYYTQRKALL